MGDFSSQLTENLGVISDEIMRNGPERKGWRIKTRLKCKVIGPLNCWVQIVIQIRRGDGNVSTF